MAWNYKEWYAAHKEEVSEKRRKKYATDPKIKAAILKGNQDSRKRRQPQASEAVPNGVRRDHGPFRSVVIEGVVYFTLGGVAASVGCSHQALRVWEKAGLIPMPAIRTTADARSNRLYTQEQIDEIIKILTDGGHLRVRGEDKSPIMALVRPVRLVGSTKWVKTALFRLGEVARVVTRAIYTLTTMEREGLLPKTPLRITLPKPTDGRARGAVRLYTYEMIEVMSKAFLALPENPTPRQWKTFTHRIQSGWEALGIFSVEVKDEEE